MTALTPTRAHLTAALSETLGLKSMLHAGKIADALIESGAVLAADELAGDEAVVDCVLDQLVARQGMLGTPRVAAAYLDALAAHLGAKP